MNSTTALTSLAEDLVGWERSLIAFLVEKERRSGSARTVQGYSGMLQDFFGRVGLPPDQVTAQHVFVWAHGPGVSGRDPSPTTIGARLSCLSSFFRFLIRMGAVKINPCDQLQRPRINPSPPRGLGPDEVRRLLAVIPDTRVGLRNRALILTFVLTGRRREEVFGMRAGNITIDCGIPFYQYRGKGGISGRRELPRPAYEAIKAALRAFGHELAELPPDAPLWPSVAGGALASATFYATLQTYFDEAGLPRAGIHIFRHSAAKLRRDAGESVEQVSSFLDHSSLQVTTTYLRRLEGQEDQGWGRVARAIGV